MDGLTIYLIGCAIVWVGAVVIVILSWDETKDKKVPDVFDITFASLFSWLLIVAVLVLLLVYPLIDKKD